MAIELAQLLINGLALGGILALGSVGLTLTYGILRLSNFAHGDFLTLGAYLTLMANDWGLPLPVAMLVGCGLTVGAFLLTEAILWGPVRRRRTSPTTMMIMSIGLALFIRNGIILIWGSQNQNYRLPVFGAMALGPVQVTTNRIVVLGMALAAVGLLHLLLQKTTIGRQMRAVADNPELAQVAGIDVQRVILWTWVVAGGLTALGGAMYGLITAVRPNMGWFLLLPMFATVILGGIGNPYGAMVAAVIVGVAQEMSTYWLPSEYKLGVALVVMMLVLLVRPQGLFRGTVA
ncbi:MAG: branched-chain amino acid ABC transporter permease [Gloeomargarita sp. SKYBB_i_bin120]|nr:branched-chain amino acid ABC transporter permease [Gloeomargarita sp. SKYB120]MDW8179140.1 branched-chain amino acid ABC transporter permease [Gloeomargarita sp. SKYBB_i_bin120]